MNVLSTASEDAKEAFDGGPESAKDTFRDAYSVDKAFDGCG